MEKQKLFIGIDPDCDKNGICWYKSKNDFKLFNWVFFQLFEELYGIPVLYDVKVYIEAGWLNQTNWHKGHIKDGKFVKNSEKVNENISKRTGANHEVGRKIVEMCEYLKIDYELIKPKKSKVDSKTFKALTKYHRRTNQEQRDAAMLVFGR